MTVYSVTASDRLVQMMVTQKIKLFHILNLVFCVVLVTIGASGTFILLSANSGAAPTHAPAVIQLNLSAFTTGLNNPIGMTNAGPGDDRLFVIEQAGVIKIVQPNGTAVATPFLDIIARVDDSDSEEGLLGLVFHPDYASNGYFYVNYTHTSGSRRTRISRFSVTSDTNVADSNSEDILLTIAQPRSNHNAGDMHFGPDGYLYIPMGDGGGSENSDNAQDLGLLLGKVIRIDVDSGPGNASDCKGNGTGNYTIPITNPMIDGAGGDCDEIWAIGLRNPWRSSFDRLTGDFYIGDVGQVTWEEIDFQPANSTGGENYGWDCYEASTEYNKMTNPLCGSVVTFTNPIFEYNHSGGNCTVIGGYIYRGSQFPVMSGRYLLTDYCAGIFWDLAPNGGSWQVTTHTNLTAFGYVSFGEDANGELYVANISNDTIYRLEETRFNQTVFLPIIMKND